MARREYAGAAPATTLGSSITASSLTITVADGSGYPTGASAPFIIAIDRGTASEEKILCLSRSGSTITVNSTSERGYDDTSATSHSAGATVEHVLGAIDLDEPNEHINNTGLDHHTQYLDATRHAAVVHTNAMIGPDAITDTELADDAVGAEHYQDGSVGAAAIATGGVTADELGPSSVITDKVNDLAITNPKLGPDAVDGTKIADLAIGNEHIQDAAVGQDELNATARVHPGTITAYAGATEPVSWFFCNGQAISRTSYANLFAVIGTTFGVGDGATTFNLPDLRGRFPLGLDNMGGVSADVVTAAAADTLGGADGDETKTLVEANLPAHTHSDGTLATDTEADHTHGAPAGSVTGYVVDVAASSLYVDNAGTNEVSFTANSGTGGAHSHDVTGATGSTGSGTALDVMNPFLAVNFLIKS